MRRKTIEREPDLFTPPAELKGMARNPDRDTSIDAAAAVKGVGNRMRNEILTELHVRGPMNDGELAALPQFTAYAYCTAGKRRGELTDVDKPPLYLERPKIVDSGLRRPRPGSDRVDMIVWQLAPGVEIDVENRVEKVRPRFSPDRPDLSPELCTTSTADSEAV